MHRPWRILPHQPLQALRAKRPSQKRAAEMARIPYPDESEFSAEQRDLLANLRRMRGRLTNYYRLFAHVPELLALYAPMQLTAMGLTSTGVSWTTLDPQLCILAHARTSVVNACKYCTGHNIHFAELAGVDAAKRAAVLGEGPWDALTSREQVALRWVEAVVKNEARRDQKLFEEVRQHFTDAEIVSLVAIAGARTMANLFQEALWTDLEETEAGPKDENWRLGNYLGRVAEHFVDNDPAAKPNRAEAV
jgi:alkylhydroperoxidase family enzyme